MMVTIAIDSPINNWQFQQARSLESHLLFSLSQMDSNAAFDSFVYPNFSKNLLSSQKFIWPKEENLSSNQELNEPVIDLHGGAARPRTTDLVRSACLSHGLFQVINHGVDLDLINSVNDHVNFFFNLPIDAKMRVHRLPGSFWGYSFAHADRFSLNLPWKEIFSCIFREDGSDSEESLFFESAFGHEFQKIRLVRLYIHLSLCVNVCV